MTDCWLQLPSVLSDIKFNWRGRGTLPRLGVCWRTGRILEMRIDVAGEGELGAKSLGAAVHHTDEGLLADMGGHVVAQPGEGGGGGRVDLAANPETPVLPPLLALLAPHVNSLGKQERLNKTL